MKYSERALLPREFAAEEDVSSREPEADHRAGQTFDTQDYCRESDRGGGDHESQSGLSGVQLDIYWHVSVPAYSFVFFIWPVRYFQCSHACFKL